MKTRLSILLIILALIAGMVSCGGGGVEYDLTITSTAGGSVTTPGEDTYTYDEGEVVDLVTEAEEGYIFNVWVGDVGTIANVNDDTTAITMNGDYSITANFAMAYALNISSTEGGRVITPGEAGPYTYGEGARVNLVAQAEGGYHFANWTGDVDTIANVNSAITSIIMSSNYTITANFVADPYFQTDAYLILSGPATSPPEERNPCVVLGIFTNIVMDSVQVDLPDGKSVTIPAYTDVFTPDIDQTTFFRFSTCIQGMPIAGGEYIFTGLDMSGEPILGATNTDIWVGVESPNPPTNVQVELIEDGILVSWDESPTISGSFEPAAYPQLGSYQLQISRIETREYVYGAAPISAPSHLVPRDKADFVEGKDKGLSLSEMEDGVYSLEALLHSIAPQGSLGKGNEYCNGDPGEHIMFTIQDGEITIK